MKEYITSSDVELSHIERGEIHEFVASSIIFEEKYATFKITHDDNCDITYDDTVDYEIGDTVVLQLITTPPNAIRSLLVNDVEMVELINPLDMTLTLTVAQLSNVINVTSGVPATVTVTDDTSSHTTYEQKDYYIGDTIIFNLSFDEDYGLNTVEFNGDDVTADVVNNTLTKVLIAAANTLVIASRPKVTVTVTDDTSSHTTYEQKTYYVGDTIIFTLSFDEGNELNDVQFNGTDVTADVVNNTLTKELIVVTNTLVITSKAKATANVTVTDDAKSHTTYEQKTYYIGDTVIFTLSFDEGNELNDVQFNGTDVTADVVNNTLTKVFTIQANTLTVHSKTSGQ